LDRKKVEGYVERSQEIVDEEPQMDEENTKRRLVEPFIEDVLSWDGFYDIDVEHSIQMGRNPKKVDYALMLEDTPVVFVEAKGLDESLTESEEDQLRSYMRQVGVDWGVLTNGERFEFLKREKDTNRPNEVTFGDLKLRELLANEEVVKTVSRESVESGESEKIANEIQRRRNAVSRLRDKKEEIAEDVVGVVTDNVGESVASVAETEAKEFVDSVMEELENVGDVETGTGEKPETTGETEVATKTGGTAVVGTLSRDEIDGYSDENVAIFPARETGIEFLEENNAWGFVRMGQEPDYISVYISESFQEIKYFAEVDKIVPADEADLGNPPESYAKFDAKKEVVEFKKDSLYELEDPIPYGEYAPMGLIYTTLRKFKRAERTEDIQ
jgi:predicted type IV restriction endonuclease